jgi:hypothetical protein
MMLLGPAIAFSVSYMLQQGFRPWEKTALAGIWLAPMLARMVAQHLFIPLGLISIATLFILVCRGALRESEALAGSVILGARA